MKKLYIGYYFATDSQENNYLHFAANKDCDKEKEFKKVFKAEYDKEIDTANIIIIHLIDTVMDYNTKDNYEINLKN